MATQYTDLLGLALPTTGELDGLWGDVVNNSITELLDSAIAGYATADVTSTSWTLTTTGSGAANEARMAILIPTGSPAEPRNIIAPAHSKVYIIANQSTKAVTLKAAGSPTPTTGCVIGAGAKALCVWDGSDFAISASVAGPATSTDEGIARFDGTTGSALNSSGVIIDDDNNLKIPNQQQLQLADANSSNYLGFRAPNTIADNYVLTMPATDGDNGQTLITDGGGNLTWGAAGGGFANIYTVGGSVGTSTNASTWTIQTSVSSDVYALAYNGSNLYLYGGPSGALATSTNAVTWTVRTSGTSSSINAIAYGNSVYAYAGNGGVVATSPTGETWSVTVTSGTTSNINALTYGTVFVYGGAGGAIASSTDGVTWTTRTPVSSSAINSVIYGAANRYVYVGAGGVVATSPNGETWSAATSGVTNQLNAVTYGNSIYVAVGDSGTVISATDPTVTWVTRTSGTSNNLNAVAYDGSKFVAVGDGGVEVTSTDAVTWTSGSTTFLSNINALVYGSTLVFGGDGSNVNAAKGSLYLLTAPMTLTLPVSPSVGDYIGVSNLTGTITSVINANGQYIMGTAGLMTIDVLDAGFNMYYSGGSKGWILV